MRRLFFWSWLFTLGLLIAYAGIGYIEQPDNHLMVGALILYSGLGIVFTATVQMIMRGG